VFQTYFWKQLYFFQEMSVTFKLDAKYHFANHAQAIYSFIISDLLLALTAKKTEFQHPFSG
jgi:hypothetical protein